MSVFLGYERTTRQQIYMPLDSFRTHFHIIGGTGKGKTTAIETMLHQLFPSRENASHFVFDRLGAFSESLLMWCASPYCPRAVRERLVYVDASREDLVIPFNPLLYTTPANGYFKVGRSCDVILRAWASQNIEEMPRLARWVFNAMWAAAQLGLTVADCAHILMPGSEYHAPIINRLPPLLRAEWVEIQSARNEAGRILESSRNRLKPFFENPILNSIFGSTDSRLDVLRFMRERRIVVLNLAPQNKLSSQVADAIGGMVLNEVLATARSLPMGVRYPTYVWLDEFQRFVGPDIEEAIPEVRQLGVRLILSHQSFSQLIKGTTDLTSLIWQPQSRMMFGVQGEDADLLANEVASLKYDPKKVKDEVYTRRQLLKGHEIIQLESWSQSESAAETWNKTFGTNWTSSDGRTKSSGWNHVDSAGQSTSRRLNDPSINNRIIGDTKGRSEGRSGSEATTTSRGEGGSEASGEGGSRSTSKSFSIGESLLPIHDEFLELSRRSYYTFEEQRALWAQEIRLLKTGQALVRIVNDPNLYCVDVERHAPGYLEWPVEKIIRRRPDAVEAKYRLIEENCAGEFFVSPQVIERETQDRLQRILNPVIHVPLLNTSVEGSQTIIPENPLA